MSDSNFGIVIPQLRVIVSSRRGLTFSFSVDSKSSFFGFICCVDSCFPLIT